MKLITLLLGLMIIHHMAYPIVLSPYYSDDMVLQRDQENTIAGVANPYTEVILHFEDLEIKTTSDHLGNWSLKLPAQKAGVGYELIFVSDHETLMLQNVAFGDIWLCAGQSNMEYTIGMFPYAEAETKKANNPLIRYFNVTNSKDGIPQQEIKGKGWKIAQGETVKYLSAVGYFFGKNLVDSLEVPIGLISVNWSGTPIEPWMSEEALLPFEEFHSFLREHTRKSLLQIEKELKEYRKSWDSSHYLKGRGMAEKWYSPSHDFSTWKKINLPTYWEDAGLPDHDGVVWFQTIFDAPPNILGDTIILDLNLIDDYDIAWVNGKKVGETFGNRKWRHYKVAKSDLKEKENYLVLRVFDKGGSGGLNFHPLWASEVLKGDWVYRVGEKINTKIFPFPDVGNVSPYRTPTILYNGMIAPLTSLKVKGVIWYQGESNVDRATDYKKLLKSMITDWRRKFRSPKLPFYVVQLANFGTEPQIPKESTWAELRNSQQEVADDLPDVEIISTIDIGEAHDIHPQNKQEVGLRLALKALYFAYDQKDIHPEGPTYTSVDLQGSRAILRFNLKGLNLIGKEEGGGLSGFSVAGDDQQFYWAKAKILTGNRVEVFSEKVTNIKAIRYAWSDNPGKLTLFNSVGLPVHPFRTDQWQLHTEPNNFIYY